MNIVAKLATADGEAILFPKHEFIDALILYE
jgi:hypothetical protein